MARSMRSLGRTKTASGTFIYRSLFFVPAGVLEKHRKGIAKAPELNGGTRRRGVMGKRKTADIKQALRFTGGRRPSAGRVNMGKEKGEIWR